MLAQLRSLQDDIFDYEVKALDPKQDREGNWEVPVKLFIKTNQNYCSFFEILDNTLSSLSLSEEEQGAYTNNNMEYYAFSPYGIAAGGDIIILEEGKDYVFLRNPMKDIASEIAHILTNAQKSCLIKTIGLKQERFPRQIDIRPYRSDSFSGNYFRTMNSSGNRVPHDEASGMASHRVVIHSQSTSSELSLSRAANVIFAEPTLIFKFSLEELGRVQGFDVVKTPIPESNIR